MKGVKYHGAFAPYRGSWRASPEDPDQGAMYVDGWRIESNRLYHRHPTKGGLPETEYDVNDRVCWVCEVTCPDAIWFAHRLQQLP